MTQPIIWYLVNELHDLQLNYILNSWLLIQLLVVDTGTLRAAFCSPWLTSQAGHQWNCLNQDCIVLVAIPYTVVQAMDPRLAEDTISTLPATHHPTQILTHTLDTPTVHHLATVMAAPSPHHSWQEVTNFDQMKLKCFMKVLNINLLNQVS